MKDKFIWNRDRIASVVIFLLAVGILWQCTLIKQLMETLVEVISVRAPSHSWLQSSC